MRAMNRAVFGLLTSWCLCTGCGVVADDRAAKDAKSEVTKDADNGAPSPEEAFADFKKAIEKGDWKTAFRFQTESSRDYIVGGMLGGCYIGTLGDDGKKLASEVADPQKLKELMSRILKTPVPEQSKFAGETAALVAKKPEFMSRALALFKAQKKENWLLGIGTAKLIRLKVVDDKATALMEIRLEKGAGREPISFRSVDGRWYVDYSDE